MSTPHASKPLGLDDAQENHVTAVAKSMVEWLLDIPLNIGNGLSGWTFKASLDEAATATANDFTIGHLLLNHPNLTHLKTGKVKNLGPVFREKDGSGKSSEDSDGGDWQISSTGPYEILSYFSYAQVLLDEMKAACRCTKCSKEGNVLKHYKRGCLRYSGITKLFLLLAHAIADGFGAPKVSGMTDPETQIKGVTEVFSDLIYENLVRWDTWFRLVACTVSGCEWDLSETDETSDSGALVAIQFGNFIAVAPWLDLTREITINGSFGLTFLEGNIEGLPDDFGILHCEHGEYTSTNNRSQSPQLAKTVSRGELQLAMSDHFSLEPPLDKITNVLDALQIDTVKAQINTAIFRADAHHYRIMTMVEAGTHLLIVDPVMVLVAITNCQTPDCSHEINESSAADSSPSPYVAIDDFDWLLNTWTAGPGTIIQMSKILDTQVKLNTALSLAHLGCIVRPHDSCCVSCAIAGVLKLKKRGSPRIISKTTPTRRRLATHHW
ncbi:hypothetical protein MMC17_007236 [Xylographa soralifera]|nr:hypothetical protein [Xylographa soralifera]